MKASSRKCFQWWALYPDVDTLAWGSGNGMGTGAACWFASSEEQLWGKEGQLRAREDDGWMQGITAVEGKRGWWLDARNNCYDSLSTFIHSRALSHVIAWPYIGPASWTKPQKAEMQLMVIIRPKIMGEHWVLWLCFSSPPSCAIFILIFIFFFFLHLLPSKSRVSRASPRLGGYTGVEWSLVFTLFFDTNSLGLNKVSRNEQGFCHFFIMCKMLGMFKSNSNQSNRE